ncbi:MAG: hypothetical protein SNJ57_10495 [Cyanobacteriota bacterium]
MNWQAKIANLKSDSKIQNRYLAEFTNISSNRWAIAPLRQRIGQPELRRWGD